ncbi:hypothetical protein HRbin40_00440 [bacterium HR40]|nr:hypothetical protein HRbin40_00440 [bacterium HR40]
MGDELEGWLRLVKMFVVVAGIVLVLGTALLVLLLVERARAPQPGISRPAPLPLPEGMRLVEASLGDGILLLRLTDREGVPHLLLVERERGRPLAFFRIEERP